MHLPQTFTDKIPLVFGQEGRAWLEALPHTLARCQERWRLTNLRLAEGLSYNLICFAEAPDHGEVVLKLGVHAAGLQTEQRALACFAGRGVCTCHDADLGLGALLLERLVPGFDLTRVTSSRERFAVAANLFITMPIAPPADQAFPSYREWITGAFSRARAENRVGAGLLAMVAVAERFFAAIDTPDRPRVLLHGDLHHMNILQDGQGRWRAIDPKGVIGVPCMGAARFMQNEFRMGDRADRAERLKQMTARFAAALGEREAVIAQCAFVEHVLATCWSVEEQIEPEALRTAVEECAALLEFSTQLD